MIMSQTTVLLTWKGFLRTSQLSLFGNKVSFWNPLMFCFRPRGLKESCFSGVEVLGVPSTGFLVTWLDTDEEKVSPELLFCRVVTDVLFPFCWGLFCEPGIYKSNRKHIISMLPSALQIYILWSPRGCFKNKKNRGEHFAFPLVVSPDTELI